MQSRIEMHLESTCDQRVDIPAAQVSVQFEAFETIHTESSYKFTRETLDSLLADAGFAVERTWMDPRKWYALDSRRRSVSKPVLAFYSIHGRQVSWYPECSDACQPGSRSSRPGSPDMSLSEVRPPVPGA